MEPETPSPTMNGPSAPLLSTVNSSQSSENLGNPSNIPKRGRPPKVKDAMIGLSQTPAEGLKGIVNAMMTIKSNES
jgi:hypothetical protein